MAYEGYCKVMVPEGRSGDVSVERFEVMDDFALAKLFIYGRGTRPGQYTAIRRGGELWMSDTHAEFYDSSRFVRKAKELGGSVLVNGLGLGVVVGHLLECDEIEHIDVVEIDEDVIRLVAPSFECDRVTVHHGDALNMKWPRGTKWQSAWHDIWQHICTDDLKEHERLLRSYGQRVEYQECWLHNELLAYRREETARWRHWA